MEREYGQIAVIGGGASGCLAAIAAARAGCTVFLLEKNEKLGRKLYATGNGRCNLTNLYMDESCYHCVSPDVSSRRVPDMIKPFSVEDLIHELYLEDENCVEIGGLIGEESGEEVLGADEKGIVKYLLQNGEANTEQLVRSTGLSASKINGLVTILEMKGIVSTAIGKIFLAKKFENLYNMPL